MDEFAKLAQVRIVLVEPAGPLNIGSIARVIKNMGLQQLVLVNPQCDRLCSEARRMAVHAVDILETAQEVTSLPAALAGCQRAIATTTRARSLPTELEHPSRALPWLISENTPSALIFGSEERGLSNAELNYAQRFVSIPSNPAYPSLNLAQAVGICSYELYRILNSSVTSPQTISDIASVEVLEGYYQQLEVVLLKIGYLYPHTANARMEKLRRLFNRSNLTPAEVAMLRGVFRQIEWAIQCPPPTKS